MRAIRSFLARHSVAIQLTGWGVFIISTALEGYLDLPSPFSVPLAAYVILVGVPFVIAASLAAPAPDTSLPKSLRNVIRDFPFGLLPTAGVELFCNFGHFRPAS
jgi:hypothetical protein